MIETDQNNNIKVMKNVRVERKKFELIKRRLRRKE
jgi:hypothetical protein